MAGASAAMTERLPRSTSENENRKCENNQTTTNDIYFNKYKLLIITVKMTIIYGK